MGSRVEAEALVQVGRNGERNDHVFDNDIVRRQTEEQRVKMRILKLLDAPDTQVRSSPAVVLSCGVVSRLSS
jgi:hypothetical protein